MEAPRVESRLPHGWVPDGASVFVVARRNDAGVWESLAPEFNIAGRGESANEALVDALELLDTYLVLCEAEGKSFEESQRSISLRFRLSILAEVLGLVVGRKVKLPRRQPRERRDQEYRIPLGLVAS